MTQSCAIVVRAFDGEAPYLQSFIDHHRQIGIEQIHVVISPGGAPLCRDILSRNHLPFIESEGQSVNAALSFIRTDYVAVVDADEYLHPDLVGFIQQESFESLAMPWRLTATLDDDGFESSVKRFFVFPQIKSVTRTAKLAHLGLHKSRSFGSGAHLGIREGLQFPVQHYYLRGLDDLLLKEGGVVQRTLARSSGRKRVDLGSSLASFPSRHARLAYVLRMLDAQEEQPDSYNTTIDRSMLDRLLDAPATTTLHARQDLKASVMGIKAVFRDRTIESQAEELREILADNPEKLSFQKHALRVLRRDFKHQQGLLRRLVLKLDAINPWSNQAD